MPIGRSLEGSQDEVYSNFEAREDPKPGHGSKLRTETEGARKVDKIRRILEALQKSFEELAPVLEQE